METVQLEGNRQITRLVDFYNLDAIISVGHRVNSIFDKEVKKLLQQEK